MAENIPEDSVLLYDETPDENWEKAVRKWRWKIISRTSEYTTKRLEGICPRCKHQMSVEVTEGFGLGLITSDSLSLDVKCNCSIAHPPAEKGQGCGQKAKILKF